jgi:hypothetical protein
MTVKEYIDAIVKLSDEHAEAVEQLKKAVEELIEQHTPAEPLIEDEKIRKAVRAWAEVNSVKEALYAERQNRSLCVLEDMGEDGYSIDLVGWIPTLKDGEVYTIAELCGEED